jgi:cell division protein FtsB
MLRRIVLPAVLGVALYYAVFGGEYSVLDVRQVQADTEVARETLAELVRVADSLALRADSLETDDRALETLARERFGLIREGEVLYRIVGPEDGA